MLGVLTIVVFTVLSADCDVTQRGRQRARPVLAASTSSRGRKPNIVLILTDDQDVELGSLNFMPKTLEAVRDQGATFRHAYVTTPMCCPSRSSLLTGMYVHNHHVYTNNDNCSSTQWQATHETRSFATYLSNAGYRTGYFGKYLNKYNGSYVPPGWREWGGLIMNSKYYNYSINMNGKKIKHGFDYHKDYYPDLIANDSIAFLRQSKKNSAHKPVMLTMSFPAPHGPEDSAPQYSHLFFNVTTHHTPSYDYAPNPDKQWILQVTQKMQPIHRQFTDLLMTKRLQTLQSVDEAVRRVVAELEALGELENTFVIYTSDHGYHLGQFGLIKGKSFPFEFDVRVPFLVRGPGVDAGSVVDDIVLNVDLAPTFLDIAGVETPPHMDGRSVLPLFLNKKRKRLRWPDTFLIESSGRRETPYLDAKLKPKKPSTEPPPSTAAPLAPSPPPPTPTTPPPRTTASPKIYDSGEDLTDSAFEEDEDIFEDADDDDDDDDVIEIDDELVDANSTNKIIRGEEGDMLDTRDLSSSKLERLAVECVQKEMSLPCRANQKWYCFNDNGRWRKHKCKSVTFQGSNNKPFRNCACFTTKGLIYRKIPRNITRRHTFYHRIKRDVDLDHILFARRKRDTLAHVDSVLRHVQGQIKDLKDVNATLLEDRSNLETNTIYDASAACVMQKGRIHCPPGVYQDRKSWRQSRHQIDNEIYQLKAKLERLKVIRRHLKHVRPTPEEDLEPNVVEAAADGERNSTRKGKRRGPSAKRPSVESSTSHHHRHNHSFSDFEVLTTESPYSSTTSKLEEEDEEGGEEDQEEDTTDHCYCESETPPAPLDERDRIKELKRKEKEERLRRKLRKQRKKDQLERECGSERMNCFHHDDDHWRTAPLWAGGPFCFCMNANNNTYSCVRTINSTHNFLYCEFTTGLVTFYNLRIDPFELQNRVNQLGVEERSHLHDQLQRLMACRGAKSCTVNNGGPARARGSSAAPHVVPFPQHTSRYKKRKVVEEGGKLLPLIQMGYVHTSKMQNGWRPRKHLPRQGKYKRERQKLLARDLKRDWGY